MNRKKVVCIDCNKEKQHFGLQRCSACLRHYKRQTRPEFYLGTQYSEIKRRCIHKDYNGRHYQGKRFCTKEEFINKFKDSNEFLKQYKIWQDSEYKRGEATSIDRIDNMGEYILDNLQILSNSANHAKDWSQPVRIYWTNSQHQDFKSQLALSKVLNVDTSVISMILNNKRPNTLGYHIEKI